MMGKNAKKSRLDKEWTTDEMDTLIHNVLLEQSLWDITNSKKDIHQKTLAKI